MDRIIEQTLAELHDYGVEGTLRNVIVTRLGPWTLSYVGYSDGTVGCGAANNEAMFNAVPDNVGFVEKLVGMNAYEAIDSLRALPQGSFRNSLIVSIASALSYKFMNETALRGEGFTAQMYSRADFPLFQPGKFVKSSDIVAMVGFHMITTPLCAQIAREVRVTELMDLRRLVVADFTSHESNIRVFDAAESKMALNGADVVFITGQTLVNGTLSQLLELCHAARTTIIYGPTAALHPKALFENGVDVALPMIFPNTDDFRRRFVDSRGYWYQMPDVRELLIRAGQVDETGQFHSTANHVEGDGTVVPADAQAAPEAT